LLWTQPEKQQFRENLIAALTNSIAILTGIFNCELVFIVGGMQPFFDKYLIKEAQKRLSGLENIFGVPKFWRKKPFHFRQFWRSDPGSRQI
jgi:predicted NBD/HSP70 family sugar kinase